MGSNHSRQSQDVPKSFQTADSVSDASKVASVLESSLEKSSLEKLSRFSNSLKEVEESSGRQFSYDTKPIPISRPLGDSSTVVLTDEEAKSPRISPPSPNLTPRNFLGSRKGKLMMSGKAGEEESDDDELAGTIPTAFDWRHGGMQVFIMGAFDNWQAMYPLRRSGNNFYTLLNLEPGVYQYKYYVDNEWRHAPELPTALDGMGNLNNIVQVNNFKSEFQDDDVMLEAYQKGMAEIAFLRENESNTPVDSYGEEWPDFQSFSREPPPCPPQLSDSCCVLNCKTDSFLSAGEEPSELKRPLTVTVNHLYRSTETPECNVQFRCYMSTFRYQTKFVTVVLYKKA
ncbi:SNF1-related protein kinase regulatory subunit beta-2 [Galdieria sulphuraria]|uniref:5'-AMP-activated protein kinase, regulatory beta subunit n=1 Tax=Galdieria sulphuraria TaxID=130081 RepID=M2X9V9_GALSU|nr:5'-AMP-activated protein kinase, regulatory beta subunit [Galdieria sulphuraria]EME26662.1 5'-AMP-activated protein kinase, regulatory beta subunit [Galdieria sulphuraria]GJD05591.1 SNF1-related protein kinase regulatory subunit beta-2 [Galdieria sulphuraria]|eukprot:XP_005703182.1 5'-AMP-activated protein kinase, regulatory beta subunit [Galdieria sulphuraria]